MKDYQNIRSSPGARLVRGQSESDQGNSIKLIGVGIIMLLVALFFVYQRTEFVKTDRHVKQLLLEKRKVMSEILPLKLEEQYLSQLNKVENYAKKHLDMIYPEKKQILKVKLKSASPAE